MQATDFEFRHPVVLHQVIVGLAFGTYVFQRDDVVWQVVRNAGAPLDVTLERAAFGVATLLVGMSAVLCTWYQRHRSLGELLYAVGLGSLAPISGFMILVGGEALRIYRLRARDRALAQNPATPESMSASQLEGGWRSSFAKWGILATLMVFTITLQDRLAEILAGLVFLAAIAANLVSVRHHGGGSGGARAGAV